MAKMGEGGNDKTIGIPGTWVVGAMNGLLLRVPDQG